MNDLVKVSQIVGARIRTQIQYPSLSRLDVPWEKGWDRTGEGSGEKSEPRKNRQPVSHSPGGQG